MIFRRFLVGVGVAALVVSLTPVIAVSTADVTTDVFCEDSAPLFRTSPGGGVTQDQHLEPETGRTSWGASTPVGNWGLPARTLPGPGFILSIVGTPGPQYGFLRRHTWNGTGWVLREILDVDPAWARYTISPYRNLITIDSLGDIYTVEPDGNLHWRRYNSLTRTWTHRIIDDEWGSHDLITAAGPGVIYRRRGPYLGRFEYHAASQRAESRSVRGSGWEQFSRIFSPGADILYAVHAGTGDLMWYRYNPDTDTWANGDTNGEPVGTRIATGWQNDYESSAAPGSCRLTGVSKWPTRPVVTPVPQAPVTLAVSSARQLHYSYVDEDGRAVHAQTASASGGTPLALEAVPGMINLTGTLSVVTLPRSDVVTVAGLGLDAEMYTNTKTSATEPWWAQAVNLGGYFSKPVSLNPNALCGPDPGRRNLFYSAFAVDQDDTLWTRSGLGRNGPNGLVRAWTQTETNPLPARATSLIVKAFEPDEVDCLRLFYHDPATASFSYLIVGGGRWPPESIALPPGRFLSQPSIYDYRGMQTVFATGVDGTVSVRFPIRPCGPTPTGWIAIPGVDAASPPSATLAPDNRFKVVVRGTDGQIYWASQIDCGGTTFTPWQAIPGTANAGTDPTAQAFDNTWVVAYRTDLDFPRLRPFVPALTATASGTFGDIPMTPAP